MGSIEDDKTRGSLPRPNEVWRGRANVRVSLAENEGGGQQLRKVAHCDFSFSSFTNFGNACSARALTWSIAHPEGEGPDDWRCFGKFVNDARSRA